MATHRASYSRLSKHVTLTKLNLTSMPNGYFTTISQIQDLAFSLKRRMARGGVIFYLLRILMCQALCRALYRQHFFAQFIVHGESQCFMLEE
jgi:hypothetical protein